MQSDTVLTLREIQGNSGEPGDPETEEQRAWSDLVEPRLLQQTQPVRVQQGNQLGIQLSTAKTEGKHKRKSRDDADQERKPAVGHDEGQFAIQQQAEAAKAWVKARQSAAAPAEPTVKG